MQMHKNRRRERLLTWMLVFLLCVSMAGTALAAEAEEGISSETLEPVAIAETQGEGEAPVQRGEFLLMLYRMSGSPSVETAAPFLDLADQSQEVRAAVDWAYASGLVNGRSETSFDPAGSITRQEAAKILFYHSGGISGMEALFTMLYDSAFLDSAEIAPWARAAMYWAYFQEIISDDGTALLSPQAVVTVTRAEELLNRYLADPGDS